VESVTHAAGTETFIVRHSGELIHAAQAVDRKVIFRSARRRLEKAARGLRRVTE
jgi:hypothetical protein